MCYEELVLYTIIGICLGIITGKLYKNKIRKQKANTKPTTTDNDGSSGTD